MPQLYGATDEGNGRLQVHSNDGAPSRYRVLLVGDHCVSKDIAAKLSKASIVIIRVPDHAAGLAAADAVIFDLVVFDAEGMRAREIGSLHDAFRRRGAKTVVVLCAQGSEISGTSWMQVEKPLSYQAIETALQPR